MKQLALMLVGGLVLSSLSVACEAPQTDDASLLPPGSGQGGAGQGGSGQEAGQGGGGQAGAGAGQAGAGQAGAGQAGAGEGGQGQAGDGQGGQGQAGQGQAGQGQAGDGQGGQGQAGQGQAGQGQAGEGQAGQGQAGQGQAGQGQGGSGGGPVDLADPALPGPNEVGLWKGKLGAGVLSPDVWVTYPKGGAAGATYPLVLFAHGFQLGVGDYQQLLQHVASHGYVVASVDFPSSFLDPDHHAPVDSMNAALALLTTTPPAEVGPIVDAGRVASMGHSLGGKAAVWAGLEGGAIKAVVALDPVDDGGFGPPSEKRPSLAPEKMGAMKVPTMLLGAQLSAQAMFGMACAPKPSNACTFAAAMPPGVPTFFSVLEAFGHMQFLDNPGCLTCAACAKGPAGGEANGKLAAKIFSVAFLGRHLRDLPYDAYLTGEIVAKASDANVTLDAAEQAAFCK